MYTGESAAEEEAEAQGADTDGYASYKHPKTGRRLVKVDTKDEAAALIKKMKANT